MTLILLCEFYVLLAVFFSNRGLRANDARYTLCTNTLCIVICFAFFY